MAAQRATPPGRNAEDEHVVDDEFLSVVVRQSPRYGRFLGAGIAVGLLLAMILTFLAGASAQGSDPFGTGASGLLRVFAVYAAVCVACGLLLTGTLALLLDRIASKRARRARAEHLTSLTVDFNTPADDTAPRWVRDADEQA